MIAAEKREGPFAAGSITCQNAARNSFVLPLALNNFADAFQNIQ
jgi:hypothetical protein